MIETLDDDLDTALAQLADIMQSDYGYTAESLIMLSMLLVKVAKSDIEEAIGRDATPEDIEELVQAIEGFFKKHPIQIAQTESQGKILALMKVNKDGETIH